MIACVITNGTNVVFFLVSSLMQEELSSLSDSLAAGVEDNRRSVAMKKPPEIQRVVMDPRELHELLHICTVIVQGLHQVNTKHNLL